MGCFAAAELCGTILLSGCPAICIFQLAALRENGVDSRLTRRALGRAFGLGLGALALPAVSRAATGPVRIGYQKSGSLVVVRQQDLLRPAGVAAEWVEFPSGPPLLEALAAGAVDFGATGDTPPIFAQAAGTDLLYVGAQPVSGASEAILVPANSPVRTVAELRGKRVAFTRGSSAHAAVLLNLAAAGLTMADIRPVALQPPDAAAAFRSGAVDAWAIWDPFFAMAELESTTRVLITDQVAAPSNAFFLASRRFAERQPQTVLALLDAINAAAAWAQHHPEELAGVMASVTGVPLIAERVAAARGVYSVQRMDDVIVARQQHIADLFAEARIIPSKIDVRSIVWTPPQQTTGSRQ